MYIYYKINKEKLLKILSSLILDINNEYVYKNKIYIEKNEILIRIKVNYSEKIKLYSINKNIYIANITLNLENREIEFYCFDYNSIIELLKESELYKELKIKNQALKSKFFVLEDSPKIEINDKNKNGLINEKKLKTDSKLESLKGIIYNAIIYKESIYEYTLKTYCKCYEEYTDVCKIIENLKIKKILDKSIYHNLKNVKNQLESIIDKSLNNANFENILIENYDSQKIVFNNSFIDLPPKDMELFQDICSYIINKLNIIDDDKEKLDLLLKYINRKITDKSSMEDFNYVRRRFFEEEFGISVKNIKSDLIQNLFAVITKYNNTKELDYFLTENNIQNSYIAYMILGGIKRFTYCPYSMNIGMIKDDKLISEIISQNLKNVEKIFYHGSVAHKITKLGLHYYLNYLYDKKDFLKSFKLDSNDILIDDTDSILKITINGLFDSKFEVFYFKRNKYLAKTIKYFESRNIELRKLKNDYIVNEGIYFNYHFIINNKIKPIDFKFEELYLEVLQRIAKNIK